MRHGKRFNHLGRKKGHREAMLKNMATSLLLHKRIFTTTAKAKALRKYVEPLITRSKDNTTHSRRVVFGYLQSNDAVTELFSVIAPKVADRPGGYTRIFKTHNRLGDNADMCMMELVDFNELMLEATEKAKKSAGKKRTRRGKKKETTAAPVAKAVEAEVETVAEEVEAVAEEVVEATPEVVETAPEAKEEAPEAKEEAPAEKAAPEAKE